MASVPWARKHSRFTLMFEAFAVEVLLASLNVSAHLSEAIDSVCKQEHRELTAEADQSLKNSRWTLLKRDHSEEEAEAFAALERKGLKVAKAWNLRELFDRFWKFKCVHTAERFVHEWADLARESGLKPIIKAAKMLENPFGRTPRLLCLPDHECRIRTLPFQDSNRQIKRSRLPLL